MIRKGGQEERRRIFSFKSNGCTVYFGQFLSEKKMLDGRGEENSARFISLSEVVSE